jgi:H+-transporting ATPase
MNGESLPKGKLEKDECLMGTMVVRGECHGTVEKTGINTELGTTAALLETDEEISHLQQLLIKIVSVLVVLSVVLCVIVLIYLCTSGGQTFTEALSFAVVVLVASIPMVLDLP